MKCHSAFYYSLSYGSMTPWNSISIYIFPATKSTLAVANAVASHRLRNGIDVTTRNSYWKSMLCFLCKKYLDFALLVSLLTFHNSAEEFCVGVRSAILWVHFTAKFGADVRIFIKFHSILPPAAPWIFCAVQIDPSVMHTKLKPQKEAVRLGIFSVTRSRRYRATVTKLAIQMRTSLRISAIFKNVSHTNDARFCHSTTHNVESCRPAFYICRYRYNYWRSRKRRSCHETHNTLV